MASKLIIGLPIADPAAAAAIPIAGADMAAMFMPIKAFIGWGGTGS